MPLPSCRNIIRLAPPLVINEEQLHEATGIIKKVFSEL
jgi:4-aminobutyrate aminotransferase-like enzyme